MSLFKTENRRSLSNQKKSRTKPGNFRIKTKPLEFSKTSPKGQIEAVMLQEYMTDPGYNYALNSKGVLSEMPNMNSQTAKLDVLVNQMGGANQAQFKLDPTLLNRLNSYGANPSGHTGKSAELSNFLQVRSVSLSNQDSFKKWKNIAAKQIAGEEKTQSNSGDKNRRLPSIVEQDSLAIDEKTKMVNSFEIKSHREGDQNTSLSYGMPKASSKEERVRRGDSGPGSLPNVNERQNNSASTREKRRRWGSESPSQEKSVGPLNDSTVGRVPKRKSSLTPKREGNNASKLESMGVNRFGPLEKIKEIAVKKSTSTKTNTQSKTSSNVGGNSNNSLSNRNKPTHVSLSVSQTKSSTQPTIDSNPKSVLNSKINLPTSTSTKANTEDKHNGEVESPSKTDFTIDQVSLHKNSSKYSNDSSRNENVNNSANNNGHFNFRIITNNSSITNKKTQSQPQAQPQAQQNKAGRGYNPAASFSSPQQSSNTGSNSTLPLLTNSQVLPQVSAVASFMSNGSAINLRPTYAGIRVIEEPKKKIVYVPPPQSNKFKFVVGGGNNSNLVKRVLAKRDWWEETESFNTLFSLKWQQTYRGYKYERLSDKQSGPKQLLNHFENHTEISTKNGLIKNLSGYCEANKINLFDLTPVTFCFDMDDEAHFDKDMQAFAKFFIKNNPDQNKYSHPNPNDKKNHNVWYNFDYRKKGSYHPPTQSSDGKKKSPYLKPIMGNTFLKESNAWVLKPVGLNRGRGIEVFNSLETLNELMNECFQPTVAKKKAKKEDGTVSGGEDEEEDLLKKELNAKSRTFVVQKYIEDVLLINKRKFDIRVWVLVTHDMQLYFFKEGYLRTSSEEFSLNGNEVFNKFIHLTNNAVQKYSDNYGQHESGNQLSFDDFAEYMQLHGMAGDFKGKILPRMKELVRHSMTSVGKLLNPHDRKHCFEVFGYDFMIDAEFNVWLIEVNTNPCIEESSPLLAMIIPRMIDDAFKLTVDKIFPRNIGKQNSQNQAKPTNNEDKKAGSQNPSPQKADAPASEDSSAQAKEGGNANEAIEEKPVDEKSEVKSDQPSTENTSQVEASEKLSEEKEASKPEKIESKPREATKLASPAPQQAKPEEVIFSVKGYSDTENMWEYLCPLPVARSPMKRDTKFGK